MVLRLEDPSYGRYSVHTLLQLSRAFDTCLQVQFVPFVSMFRNTFTPAHAERAVPSFDEEAGDVAFESEAEAGPAQLRQAMA